MQPVIQLAMAPPSMARGAEGDEVVASRGGQAADAANLDADGAEVGEPAQGIDRHDGRSLRHARVLDDLSERAVGDDFVGGHGLAEQTAIEAAVGPVHAEQPCDGREEEAEQAVEVELLKSHCMNDGLHDRPLAEGDQAGVDQRDHGDEGDEHGGDVDGQPHAF